MSFIDYLSKKKVNTAVLAKERLQIIVSHERNLRNKPDYLPQMQKDILEVVRKYIDIDLDQVEVQLENNGSCSVLELNVTLPATK